ncbi:hypothetical protein [Enterobacter sp. KBR-315C3_2022]|uniref:hypothetical protein n=1 Tax=Enterobacter sp. KBR-315C3_2022 TaxID=3242494 RepID=UPI003527EF0D
MRKVSINGAVFIFMARGEKLKDSDWIPSNGTPDMKYVLWPRGEGWDVRYLKFGTKGVEWLPIQANIFFDESSAWQGAFGHWMEICERMNSLLGLSGSDNQPGIFNSCDTFATLGFDNEKTTF